MTATAPADPAAASRLVAALEHAWTGIRRHHPEVPQVVIVVASGSDPRSRRLNLGHFAAGRWQLTSPDQPSDRAEVLVSGKACSAARSTSSAPCCMRPPTASPCRMVSDTSRQGRYHNRRYATLAGELGLEVAHVQPIGWSATSVPDPTAARYVEVLTELDAALVLWRRAEQAGPAGPGRAGSVPQRPGLLLRLRSPHPGWPARCSSWRRSCAPAAPSRSRPRTTRNIDASASTAAGPLLERDGSESCRSWL